jgi:RNA polymerase sigma-70 factor, ECF subfamily
LILTRWELDEPEVIQRCRDGDQTAFEALFQQYAQKALRTAYLMCHQQPLAEDAVQETFIQVWHSIHALRETHAFRAWFFQILINRIRRLGKRDSCDPFLSLETTSDHCDQHILKPEDQVEHAEELHRVQAAIALLPEPHRTTLILRYYSGLSETEIGQTLGIPTGTVKSRLNSARVQLQEHLTINETEDSLPTLKNKTKSSGDQEGCR